MRFISGKKGISRNLYLVIAVIVIIAAISGTIFWFIHSSSGQNETAPRFSKLELEDHTITEGETVLLKTQIENPTENTYDNLKIQIASVSPKAEMKYADNPITEENGEYRLTVSVNRSLRTEEKTGLYNFDLGGELYDGVVSMTFVVNARVLHGGDICDERSFELTVESKQ